MLVRPAPPHWHEGKYRAAMSFSDSYLGRLRKRIGNELVLMPGAMIALRRPADGRILLTRRADDGTWCLPAGAAEPGGSFAATAMHTIIYPNGDETHCFAVCFLAERWRGEVRPDGEETTKIEFADPADPPSPIHRPTSHALVLLSTYLRSGRFQLR
jgi:8-oxo-dGTP pyrophosphatase MutT (NUDIX family)